MISNIKTFPYLSLSLLLISIMFLIPVTAGNTQVTLNDFEARTYSHPLFVDDLPYRLFIPENYDSLQTYPIVIFLHGAGESGTDNEKQITANMGARVWAEPDNQAVNPSFVLAPQSQGGWANFQSPGLWVYAQMTINVIDELLVEFNIDPDRLYLTGLSMGGFGTFDITSKLPNKFAAAIPVCGGGNTSLAGTIANIPFWIFHSDDDGVVPVENSRQMYQALLDAGAANLIYTEYTGYGHASWIPAYAEPELQKWTFAQKNNVVHNAPLCPLNLASTDLSKWQVDLAWEADVQGTYPESGAWFYNIYRDGVKIDTTRKMTYSDKELLESTTYTYEVRAVNYYLKESENNPVITATTVTDLTAPELAGCEVRDMRGDTVIVRVEYSDVMDQVGAEDVQNYTIDSNASIVSAKIDTTYGQFVYLDLMQLNIGTEYTLTVSNIKDRSNAMNEIASNSQISFVYEEWIISDIGSLANTGTLSIDADVFTIKNKVKGDISQIHDNCTLVRKNTVGDFSISTRIDEITTSSGDSKAGLMIRESLDPDSKGLSLVATQDGKLIASWRFQTYLNTFHKVLSETVTLPVYIKIERTDNTFFAYRSDNGIDWGNYIKIFSLRVGSELRSGLCAASVTSDSCSAQFSQVEIDNNTSGVSNELTGLIFEKPFEIHSAYPNPFNPEVTVSYSVYSKEQHPLNLRVYNVLGQLVYQESIEVQAGNRAVKWHGLDNFSRQQSSGTYLIELEYGRYADYTKVMLMR
jgi:poly(3-hydroxybutyrate) depolymerase